MKNIESICIIISTICLFCMINLLILGLSWLIIKKEIIEIPIIISGVIIYYIIKRSKSNG